MIILGEKFTLLLNLSPNNFKNKKMIVEKNKVVSLSYELKVKGQAMETVGADAPLQFLFGTGNLLLKFEQNLDGLKLNDSFDFELKSEAAYGAVNKDAIVDVPVNAFEVDGKIDHELLQAGNHVPMLDQSGNRLNGLVLQVDSEFVRMDFNHPLAGDDLHFSGKIVDIREANTEELEHGHIHGAGSCENCDDDNCHSKQN